MRLFLFAAWLPLVLHSQPEDPCRLRYGLSTPPGTAAPAEQPLLQQIAVDADNSEPRLRLAVHYFKADDRDRMRAALNPMLDAPARFPDGNVKVAELYQCMGIIPDALAVLDRRLRVEPADAAALSLRAALWLEHGQPNQWTGALGDLRTAARLMPADFTIRHNLARAMLQTGNPSGALAEFREILRQQPDNFTVRLGLLMALSATGDHAAALAEANDILKRDPSNITARMTRANSFLADGKLAEAEVESAGVMRRNPENRDARYMHAYLQFRAGKFDQASAEFEQLYQMNPPDLRGLMGLTEVDAARNQPERALERLDDALAKNPASPTLTVAWGNIAVRSGRIDDGILAYRKVLATDPDSLDLHMRIAEAYRQKPDLAQAIEWWRRAELKHPAVAAPALNRAMALAQRGMDADAAPLYAKVLQLEPDNVVALNNYAFYLAQQRTQLDLALTYAHRAAGKAPTDLMVADTLGYVYLQRRDFASAVSLFQSLVQKNPNVAILRLHLAQALALSGDAAASRRECAAAQPILATANDREEYAKLCRDVQ